MKNIDWVSGLLEEASNPEEAWMAFPLRRETLHHHPVQRWLVHSSSLPPSQTGNFCSSVILLRLPWAPLLSTEVAL